MSAKLRMDYRLQVIGSRIVSRFGIKPDNAAWFAHLRKVPSFHFPGKVDHLTARKETRACGDAYWIAYLHFDFTRSVLHMSYVPSVSRLSCSVNPLKECVRRLRSKVPGTVRLPIVISQTSRPLYNVRN
jgi:hypothetical protein